MAGFTGVMQFVKGLVDGRPFGTFTPQMFGAKADGATNDGPAVRAAIAAMVAAGGGTVLFPKGTYYIGEYRDTSDPATDPGDIEIVGIDGFCLSGYGAKLDFKGNFDRSSSSITSVNLVLLGCKNFRIEGLELDGNVDRMTNSSGSTESAGAKGIVLGGCFDGTLVDVRSHHWATDGIYYGLYGGLCCRRILTQRCRFDHNARGNCTPTQIRDSVWDHCDFSYAGVTEGAYAGHAPQFGVDIEPTATVAAGTIDQNTGNLTFRDCKAEFNVGPAMTAVVYDRYEGYIRVRGGSQSIDPAGNGSAGGVFRVVAPEALIENVTFHTETTDPVGHAGYIDLTWAPTLDATRVVYRGCKIYGNSYGMLAQHDSYFVVEGCEFIGTHTAAMTVPFPGLNGAPARSVFRNNRVFLPAAAGTGAISNAVSLGVARSEGNVYRSDYAGAGALVVNYDAATVVLGERFPTSTFLPSGVAVGAAILAYPYSLHASGVAGNIFLPPVTVAWNPPSLATGAQQSTTVTVTGAVVGDGVIVSFSQPLAGSRMWGEVTAANTVTVYHRNDSGTTADAPNGTLRVVVVKG